MQRQTIPINTFSARVCGMWAEQWFLLTCGDFQSSHFNTMTVAWGSFGAMWKKPFAQVVVRPTRYTYEFMEKYDSFTLCAFPEQFHRDLTFLGSTSGRDRDKIAETGLTPIASSQIASPGFDEAELIVECRKIYWDDFKPPQFLDPTIEDNYPLKDYHRVYFGEIVAIAGIAEYLM